MKGLEISEKFYNEFGKIMLENEFPELLPFIAVGFVGSGSERYGFDDDISRDHDFEAGFSIFLPDESVVDSRKEFQLERAYNRLPKEFEGLVRPTLSPVGGGRNGPVRTADFYTAKIGSPNGELSLEQWLTTPDYAFAEATNGKVFYDGYGEFTAIRNKLINIPEDVRLKRLAGNILMMAQSGQYNLPRSIKRGEFESAQTCMFEFVNSAIKTLFLLKGKFAPYYKWTFPALKSFEDESIVKSLSFLLTADGSNKENLIKKYDEVESVASKIIEKLIDQNLTKAVCGDLEKHAYSVNDRIEDGTIRNLNILVSV